MDSATRRERSRTSPLFLWISLFLFLSIANLFVAAWLRNGRLGGWVEIALLVGLYLVLIFRPSDAKEVNRLIDVEAATATLGITMWTGLVWEPLARALHWETHTSPALGAEFIFVVYLISRGLIFLRFR